MPAMPPVLDVEEQPEDSSEYKLRKQLLLLAMLVVSVTYVAGLSPPGGTWQSDDGPGGGVTAGEPVLRSTHHGRYLAFFYCNAVALAASLVVTFLLLLKHPNRVQLAALRLVMVLDLLALMGAYLAGGSCRDRPATVYTAALVLALSAYVGVHILQNLAHADQSVGPDDDDAAAEEGGGGNNNRSAATVVVLRPKERRKVLLLLATFAVAITYVAGLNPPGGFWDTPDGAIAVKKGGAHPHRYRPGESLVEAHHGGHFRMFFYCNTTTFVASLFIIVLLLEQRLGERSSRSFALQVFLLGALLGLLAAYAAGSCRYTDTSVYVVSLLGAVLAFIFLAMVGILSVKHLFCASHKNNTTADADNDSVVAGQSSRAGISNSAPNGQEAGSFNISIVQGSTTNCPTKEGATEKVKSLVLLLANLAATITYQAGLDPPGGFWPEDRHGHHRAGDAILLSKHPTRYAVFFYCNSVAFVASLVAILMVQNVRLVRSNTLLVAMMLDMFALVGAYAAGSCRDAATSVHVVALAGAVLVYVLVHVLFCTLGTAADTDADGGGGNGNRAVAVVEKKHKRLLLLAILVATITYQVGLTPPGGFWAEDDPRRGRRAGDAVLLDNFPRRYKAFFYCNTASFMASIALVLLLVNPNISRLAMRCYALYACQVAGLLSLLGAYAAGSARSLRTSVFVCLLVAAVIAFIVVLMVTKRRRKPSGGEESTTAVAESPGRGDNRDADETKYRDEVYAKRKYLMLLGILAASVTYQAGLAPPGGLWQEDGRRRREAGNPVMHDTDPRRYHVFFYSNSTSFVASVVVIALLLQQILRRHRRENHDLLLLATNTAVVLDLLGLLAAYAAGSTRQWRSVALLPLLVLGLMALHGAVWLFCERRRCGRGAGAASNDGRQPGTEPQVLENGQGQSPQSQEAV